MPITNNPYYELKNTKTRRIDYAKINSDNKENIIWIKFNTSGIISVIGTGCDIYFTDATKNNTKSGRINIALNQEWDDRFVLIFPLREFPDDLNRSDIESGIGNYLIAKGITILDYYSHNY